MKLVFFKFFFWLRWVFCCCARAFSGCGEWGLFFVAVRGLFIEVASLCCGAQALGVWASVVVAYRLSSCGTRT